MQLSIICVYDTSYNVCIHVYTYIMIHYVYIYILIVSIYCIISYEMSMGHNKLSDLYIYVYTLDMTIHIQSLCMVMPQKD